jgi:hypothetical protein
VIPWTKLTPRIQAHHEIGAFVPSHPSSSTPAAASPREPASLHVLALLTASLRDDYEAIATLVADMDVTEARDTAAAAALLAAQQIRASAPGVHRDVLAGSVQQVLVNALSR